MLVLHPEKVTFAGRLWENVESIAIDRLAHKLVQEWSDDGPHVVFVDVPEQRVRVSLVQKLESGAMESVVPGDAGTLGFQVAHSASDAARTAVAVDCVVSEVRHDLARKGGLRSVVLWAVAADGASDPVRVEGSS